MVSPKFPPIDYKKPPHTFLATPVDIIQEKVQHFCTKLQLVVSKHFYLYRYEYKAENSTLHVHYTRVHPTYCAIKLGLKSLMVPFLKAGHIL